MALDRVHRRQLDHREAVLPREDGDLAGPGLRVVGPGVRPEGRVRRLALAGLLDGGRDGRRDDVVEALRPLLRVQVLGVRHEHRRDPVGVGEEQERAVARAASAVAGEDLRVASPDLEAQPPERLEIRLEPSGRAASRAASWPSGPPCRPSRSAGTARRRSGRGRRRWRRSRPRARSRWGRRAAPPRAGPPGRARSSRSRGACRAPRRGCPASCRRGRAGRGCGPARRRRRASPRSPRRSRPRG